MAEVLKWHRDAAEAVMQVEVGTRIAPVIAAHDPSAELLRECYAWVRYMPHKSSCMWLRDVHDDGTPSHPCDCGRQSLIERLAEAGVRP